MDDIRSRGRQSIVAPVAVEAHKIGEPLSVTGKTDLVIGLVEAAVAQPQLTFLIALKSRPRHDVEDGISAVAVGCRITSPLHFEVINIFRIHLWRHIAGDIGVRHRNTVDQPADLVPAANMQEIVCDIGSRNVVGNHRQAVAAIRAGRPRNPLSSDKSRRRW